MGSDVSETALKLTKRGADQGMIVEVTSALTAAAADIAGDLFSMNFANDSFINIKKFV